MLLNWWASNWGNCLSWKGKKWALFWLLSLPILFNHYNLLFNFTATNSNCGWKFDQWHIFTTTTTTTAAAFLIGSIHHGMYVFFQSCWPTRDHIGRSTGISNPAWHLPQVRCQGLFRPQVPCTPTCLHYQPIAYNQYQHRANNQYRIRLIKSSRL